MTIYNQYKLLVRLRETLLLLVYLESMIGFFRKNMNSRERKKLLFFLQKESIKGKDIMKIATPDMAEELLRIQWESASCPVKLSYHPDFETLWNGIEKKVETAQVKPPFRIPANWKLVSRYAAVILFALISFSAGYWINQHRMLPSDQVIVANPKGTISEVRLPDNSRVWINAASEVQYSSLFNQGNREVWLTGEAYFQVESDPKNPFVVKTKYLNVIASGTEFYINAYPEQEMIHAGLVSGEIRVEARDLGSGDFIQLIEYQRITYSPQQNKLVEIVPTQPDYFSWRSGRLVLDDLSLKEIAFRLENWYNKVIEVDRELRSRYRFTLTVEDEPLSEILSLLEKTAPILAVPYEDGGYKIIPK